MMVSDLHTSDERLLEDIDAEQKQLLQDLITLELDEQRAHDVELSQLDDDILYYIDSKIEDTIAQIEQADSDDDNSNCDWYQGQPVPSDNDSISDNDSELTPEALIDAIIEHTNMSDIDNWGPEAIALMVANPVFTILREAKYNTLVYFADGTHRVFLRSEVDEARQQLASLPPLDVQHANAENSAIDNEHSNPAIEDNYSDDTDTDDGAEDVIGLIESNMKLLAFLSCQSNTIARLRARNIRLRNRIQVFNDTNGQYSRYCEFKFDYKRSG